ncbi:dihydrodipicolinate synthase family protein [Chelatococcus asaccharovorans]|uniref:dihydrodipicolinate synthase family protein n=1 Tax=Chelatococcus asaccharovorans TaxID=28210 RepID=UPI00224C6CEC|nr:dihydrodipicolinate synthase family protein [Chelatococcus asaccharovorans]CAH1662332.1 Dihydrodipicolinate synthase/N-acetylneuraminate lyase [Chelatococcus asaccharovorans]CAH1683203.1 Dihydrodipicolinate synthase/N-acetylneuraminate lyase [Chelatococcus asaccharovorans]
MKIDAVAFHDLTRSVIAVPPLAQTPALTLAKAANATLINYLEQGGVSTLMYGGNANFYNLPVSAYAETLTFLAEAVAPDTWIIPAVGPDFGRMMDQAPVVRDLKFPTAMALPAYAGSYTSAGLARSLRYLSDKIGAPVLMYAKHDRCIAPADLRRLVDDGVVGWVKYAVVRQDPAEDDFLRALIDVVDPRRIISGIGERPVITHFEAFGLSSFTSGSVTVAPRLSSALLRALQAGDRAAAHAIRDLFMPLEDCRDAFGPARTLHDAVTLADVADMGPIAPLQSNLNETERVQVAAAARDLANNDVAALAA